MRLLLLSFLLIYSLKSQCLPTISRISTIDSCTNAVGLFEKSRETLCENQSFSILTPGLIIADPNDTLVFVVTTDPDKFNAASGAFIKMISSKLIEYDASYMSYNNTYYIIVLLGKTNGKGGIDFKAGCVQCDGPKPFLYFNCNCDSINAGRLDSSVTEVCADQCVTIRSIYKETLNPGDVVMYVLHQSSYNDIDPKFPRLDTFYSINDIICFNPKKMLTGKTYYITRIVGSRLSNTNIIDPKDPCIRSSNNQPIIWEPYPTADAGGDFRKRTLVAKLNATTAQFGVSYWRLISGPGKAVFEDYSYPKTNVRVDAYGNYCFEWSVNFLACFSRDTVCVDFYKLKTTNPKSPNSIFEDRNKFSDESKSNPIEIFTPNLISRMGNTFISIEGELNYPLTYTWIDNIGNVIHKDKIPIESDVFYVKINSPIHPGFYFLIIEINGFPYVRKICII